MQSHGVLVMDKSLFILNYVLTLKWTYWTNMALHWMFFFKNLIANKELVLDNSTGAKPINFKLNFKTCIPKKQMQKMLIFFTTVQ